MAQEDINTKIISTGGSLLFLFLPMRASFSLLFLIHFTIFGQSDSLDYNDQKFWAVLPTQYPEGLTDLIQDTLIENTDIFYVYPTLLVNKKDTAWNYQISNEKHRSKVIEFAVKFQASAWANTGKLYVPFYRQAHLRSYDNLDGKGREALLLAYSDIKRAFSYYLEHHNNGNAIILAGHSQGSTHISLLLKDFFDGKPLQNKLIAAYLPGIGLEENHYESIKLLQHKDSVGGFVTWNTFKKKYSTPQYNKWYKGKAAINPVTWDTTSTAQREQHKGFLFSNGKMYRKSFETNLINGGIWITTPKFPYRYLSFTMSNYHVGDVNLFWEDIRVNTRNRAQHYWKRQKNITLH